MRYLVLAALIFVAACKEELAKAPPAVEMTEDTLAHFCQMNISEHPGPKGQVHLEGFDAPIFFAQVRDLMAYLKSGERDADILAVYVSDMGRAASWDDVAGDNWIAAEAAHFVVDAGVAGGMGAPEIVPFATPEGAASFVERYGGVVVSLEDIPDEAALAPVDLDQPLKDPA